MIKSSHPPLLGTRVLTGHHVYDGHGEDLGHIEELMINIEYGYVEYAVLSCGGLFGLGEKLFAVPWEMLRFEDGARRIVLDIDRELLHETPAWDSEHWPGVAPEVKARTTPEDVHSRSEKPSKKE